eukprot:gene12177-14438_t
MRRAAARREPRRGAGVESDLATVGTLRDPAGGGRACRAAGHEALFLGTHRDFDFSPKTR